MKVINNYCNPFSNQFRQSVIPILFNNYVFRRGGARNFYQTCSGVIFSRENLLME